MISIFSVIPLYLILHAGGENIGTATGFLWKHGSAHYLISNCHVFSGRHPESNEILDSKKRIPDGITVLHNANKLGEWLPVTYGLYTKSGKPKWKEHPKHGQRVDVAVLPITLLPGTTAYPLNEQQQDDIEISPSMSVSITGFPLEETAGGFFAVWKTGFLASEPDIDFNNMPVMLIDANTLPGNSGSPVIVYTQSPYRTRGGGFMQRMRVSKRIVGVYSGRTPYAGLGMVWKTSVIEEIIGESDN